jgi:hypothetical protein
MALAMIYPETFERGRGKTVPKRDGFSKQRLSDARTVLRHSRALAEDVLADRKSLDAARWNVSNRFDTLDFKHHAIVASLPHDEALQQLQCCQDSAQPTVPDFWIGPCTRPCGITAWMQCQPGPSPCCAENRFDGTLR